jgi:hypothetical protein
MPYYPKSQITANLYTNGGEFVYINTFNVYVGYYWKNSKGKFFTGKTPQDLPSKELTVYKDPINETFNTQDSPSPVFKTNYLTTYDVLKKIDSFQVTYLPTYSPNIPTLLDYQIGEFRRYFCKKTNEIIYLEINKDTYDKLIKKDPTILYQLYQPFNLPWQISGDKTQIFTINKNITESTSKNLKLPMLSEYLKNDFTKYYK